MTTPTNPCVIGFDPGIGRLGYAVLRGPIQRPQILALGCIETSQNLSHNQRLLTIAQQTKKLLQHYQPDAAGLERLFFSKNVKTALSVAEARGVINLLLTESGCRVLELSPQEVKIAATGQGGADKRQVQKMLKLTFHLTTLPKLDDAADALAIALAVLVQPKFLQK